ncbi:MAG: TonB-dependent receptor [Acidobacteria bacterium]|nr:TonB-dependent receptor [Acidobacteriota bacterium]
MKLNRIMRNTWLLLSFALLAFSLQLTAQPQGGGTTLHGTVVDELDAVVPGAKVTIVLPGGKTRVVTTAADGTFSIPGVNAGVYNFFVQIKGFQPFVVSDLKMPREEAMKVTLLPASVEEATDIVADAAGVSVEPDQNLTATVLGEDFIKDLPNNEDDMLEVLQALAGPGASASGQSGAEVMVNGFRGGRLPPKEAILKITINQNPYSAEFSNPGFGRIEITTKPGNDNWRGSVGADFRNSALDARNAFAIVKPDVRQETFRFNLSGPIIKKRMSFFFNFDRRDLNGGSTTNAIIPTGNFVANVLAPNDNTSFNIRADYLINQKNTLGLSYNRSQRNSDNQEFAVSFGGGFGGGFGPGGGGGGGGRGGGGGFGGGGASGTVNFTLPERGTNSNSVSHNLQLMNTTIISSRLINEARLQMGYDNRKSSPVSTGVAINVLDAFNGGGSPNGLNNSHGFDYELQNYLTYTLKKHTLKGGVQVRYTNEYSYSLSNFNGTYTFPSLGEYCRIAGVTCSSTLNSTARGRYQFTVSTGNPKLKYSQTEYGLFINDDFRFSPTFTLSLGLRSEFQNNLGDKNNFAPRLGIAWSPFKDRKTTFRFGSGVFYQSLSTGMYSQILRFNGTTQQNFVIENPTFNPNYKPGDPLPGNATLQPNSTVRIFAPNLVAPTQYNFNASVERQLPLGLNASVNFIYFRGTHLFRTRNINARRLDLLSTIPSGNIELTRPDPTRSEVYQIETSANSEFKSFQVRLDRRMSRRFSFFGNYAYTDARNNASTPADNYNLAGEWGRFFGGHSGSIMGRLSLPKGINLSPMLMLRTGNPYNITLGQDLNRDNDFSDRPAGISRNSNLPASLYSQVVGCRSGVLNTATNTCTGGQSLADYLRQTYPNGVKAIGPGSVNVNLNISKAFGFGKRDSASANAGGPGSMGGMGGGGGRGGGGGMRGGGPGGFGGGMGGMMGMGGGAEGARYTLQLSAQISNLFNHVNFGQYSGTLTSPYFGIPNSAAAGRQFEMGMRFSF